MPPAAARGQTAGQIESSRITVRRQRLAGGAAFLQALLAAGLPSVVWHCPAITADIGPSSGFEAMPIGELRAAGRRGDPICGVPACQLGDGGYVYAPVLAADAAAARKCLRLRGHETRRAPHVHSGDLDFLGPGWAVAVEKTDGAANTRRPKCELVAKPSYQKKKQHMVAVRPDGIIALQLAAPLASMELSVKLDARPDGAAKVISDGVAAGCPPSSAGAAACRRLAAEVLGVRLVLRPAAEGGVGPAAGEQGGAPAQRGPDDEGDLAGEEGGRPPGGGSYGDRRSWFRRKSGAFLAQLAEVSEGLVKEFCQSLAARLRAMDLAAWVPSQAAEPGSDEGDGPGPSRAVMPITKRLDFWYTSFLMLQWMPGPQSAWPAVLERSSPQPASTKRKREGAAALDDLFAVVIGKDLQTKFVTWLQIESGRRTGTTVLVVTADGKAALSGFFRDTFGPWLLEQLEMRRMYLELNKIWRENVAKMPADAQAVVEQLAGGGRCPTCPFSGFEAAALKLKKQTEAWDKMIVVSDYKSPPRSAGAYFPLDWLTRDPDVSYENSVRAGSLVPQLEQRVAYVEFRAGADDLSEASWIVDTKNHLQIAIDETSKVLDGHMPLVTVAVIKDSIEYVRVAYDDGVLKLTVRFKKGKEAMPAQLAASHSAVVANRVEPDVEYEFAAYACYDLGMHLYVDYRQEWKKTTELIKIGTTMAVLGSMHMRYREHSRTGLRIVGSYSGKDDRLNMDRQLGSRGWGLLGDMDRIADRPIVGDWLPDSGGQVAFLRGMCFSYDSKAHEAVACAGTPISDNPNPATDAKMSAWQVQDATKEDLVGNQNIDSWLNGDLGEGRAIGMRAEMCAIANDQGPELKYVHGFEPVVSAAPEISALLRLAADEPDFLPRQTFWPNLLETRELVSKLNNYDDVPDLEVCKSGSQSYYVLDTELSKPSAFKALGIAPEALLPTLVAGVKEDQGGGGNGWAYVQRGTCETLIGPGPRFPPISAAVRLSAAAVGALVSATAHAATKVTATTRNGVLAAQPILSLSGRWDVQLATEWFCERAEDSVAVTAECRRLATDALQLSWVLLAPEVTTPAAVKAAMLKQLKKLLGTSFEAKTGLLKTHSKVDIIALRRQLFKAYDFIQSDDFLQAADLIDNAVATACTIFGVQPGFGLVDRAAILITTINELGTSVALASLPDGHATHLMIKSIMQVATKAEAAFTAATTTQEQQKAARELYIDLGKQTKDEAMAACHTASGSYSGGLNWVRHLFFNTLFHCLSLLFTALLCEHTALCCA